MKFALIACCVLAAPPTLREVMEDPRTIWYDETSVPEAYPSDAGLYRLGYNLATFPGQEDATGSANNEHPWRHTGGLDDCDNVAFRRLIWIPPGEKIRLRYRERMIVGGKRHGLRYRRAEGTYPVGTTVAELLYEGDRLFEIRSRQKTRDGWDTEQIGIGAPPAGYKPVSNCVECHEDIGKHSQVIDPERDWYGWVRGLEPGGPIHFHVWDTTGLGEVAIPLRVRDNVRHLVEWER